MRDAKNHYRLTLTRTSYVLAKTVGGKASVLAKGQPKPRLAVPYALVVKRRSDLLTVVAGRQVVAECTDDTFPGGRAAIEVTRGVPKLTGLQAQTVAPIHVSDDFMVAVDPEAARESVQDRTAVIPSVDLSALSSWDKVSGDWRLFSVLEEVREVEDELLQERIAISERKPDAARSSNPFSLSGQAAKGQGMVLRGHDFWDNYRYAASVNSSGSHFGLVFYYRGAKDYFALEWAALSLQERANPIRLVRVTPKGREVLGAAYARSKIGQWYRLEVETCGRRILCYLDGYRIFDVIQPDALAGRVGFIVRGTEPTHFDDVAVDTTTRRRFDSPYMLSGHAQLDRKHWAVAERKGQPLEIRSLTAKPPAAALGVSRWTGHRVSCQLQAPSVSCQVGLALGGLAVEWSKGAIRLTTEENGKPHVLAEAALPLVPNRSYRLALDTIEATHAHVYVDGMLHLRAALSAPVVGLAGLTAGGQPGVAFSDVQVAFVRDEDRERPGTNAIFTEDPYMLHWSAPQGAWVPIGDSMGRFWHKGDFFGAFSIRVPFGHNTQVLFCTDRPTPGSDPSAEPDASRGYAVKFNYYGKSISFARLGKPVKTVTLPPSVTSQTPVTVARNGHYIWLEAGGRELMTFRDPSPLKGARLALWTGRSVDADYFADVVVARNHVHDDYFDRAPSDWRRVGQWRVINRFACDPRWSHMTAWAQDDLAVLYTKAEYAGDFTLEFYAGNKMWPMREWDGAQYYPRVGDICAAVCCDGERLDSGYVLTLAEWDTRWSETYTRLRRGTKIVAQSDREFVPRNRTLYPNNRVIPVPWIRKGRGIHGAWYYIKIRKIGSRIEYYFDNELALSYTDPNPLKGRRLAIWTQDNYVTFARIKVSYDERSVPSPLVPAPKAAPKEFAVEKFAGPETDKRAVVTSLTHPGASFGFEGSLAGWTNDAGVQGAFLAIDTDNANFGEGCLRVTNMELGGKFGVRAPIEALPLADADLQFYYRLDPDAKVNFYFQLEDEFDRWYFVEFSAPVEADARMVKLGAFSKPRADGRWRLARFALGEALRQARPGDPEQRVEAMYIGYFHEGYLRAGIGGNHRGTSYWLDNFTISTPGPKDAQFRLALSSGKAKGYSTCLEQTVKRRRPTPPRINTPSDQVTVRTTRPGKWYFKVQACDERGKWTPVTSYAFTVPSGTLTAASIRPADKADWGGSLVYVQLTPRSGPDLAQDTLRVSVNGQRIEGYPRAVSYDVRQRRLSIRVEETPIEFADGQKVRFDLDGYTSLGQALHSEWTYTMRHSLDRWAPKGVRLLNYPAHLTFDVDTAAAEPWNGSQGALLSLDRRSRRSGLGLKATNVHMGGTAGVMLLREWTNLGRCPIVSFDYRLPATYPMNLVLDAGGQTRIVQLTDTDRRATRVAKVDGAVGDDSWRHAEVNVADIIRKSALGPAGFYASYLALGDAGYQGIGPNMEFHLDNFVVVPAVSGRMGVDLEWSGHDPSGIGSYRYGWSTRPVHTPYSQLPGTVTRKTFFADDERYLRGEGDVYFHISAQDRLGRRSTASHYRFLVDNTPPQWGSPSPAPGSRSAATQVTIPLVETGSGVDVSTLALEVNGQPYDIHSDAVSFSLAKNEITWDWAKAEGAREIGNGAPVACTARGARDFAGNLSPTVQWSWSMDHGRDSEAPGRPEVAAPTQRILCRDTFEQDTGEWMSMSALSYRTRLYRSKRTSKPVDYCMQVYNYTQSGNFGAHAWSRPYRVSDYPIISFDYCFQRGVMVDMAIQIKGEFYIVKLSAPEAHHKVIGRAEGFVADYRWHTAWVDLRPMVEKVFPKAKDTVIEAVGFGDFGASGNVRKSFYRIDNFAISGAGAAKATFRWSARDMAGIQAYHVAVDQQPATEPPAASKTTNTALTCSLAPGMWRLHVKAQDRAGNWGPSVHYPYFVDAAPKR